MLQNPSAPTAARPSHSLPELAQPDLAARSQAAVWHPCTQMKRHEATPPLAVSHGTGAWLVDTDGKRYLDGISSWWVNLFGHAHPYINAAVKAQLDRLPHVMLAGCTHAPVVELSERLSALTGGVLGHCFYASDGASAVEIALKMSMHFWRNHGQPAKHRYACLAGGYHGETVGALSVTDVPIFKTAYAPLLHPAHVLPTPDARQAAPQESAEAVAQRAAQALETLLQGHADTLAALIIEPLVQCASGMAMYAPEYLRRVRALCDQYHVHLIADEIAVGCGRTGTFFACEQGAIWPDFLTLSKGISGGYLPLSLVMTRPAIYEAFYDDEMAKAFLHSHSYTGNPLACAAALATLDVFVQHDVLQQNQARAARLRGLFEQVIADPAVRAVIQHPRQQGMIFAFDVALPEVEATATFARRFHVAARARGLLLRPIGTTVYWMPPYILSDAEQDYLADTTLATLREVLSASSHASQGVDAALGAALGAALANTLGEAPCA